MVVLASPPASGDGAKLGAQKIAHTTRRSCWCLELAIAHVIGKLAHLGWIRLRAHARNLHCRILGRRTFRKAIENFRLVDAIADTSFSSNVGRSPRNSQSLTWSVHVWLTAGGHYLECKHGGPRYNLPGAAGTLVTPKRSAATRADEAQLNFFPGPDGGG
jgi:hypothetical protein